MEAEQHLAARAEQKGAVLDAEGAAEVDDGVGNSGLGAELRPAATLGKDASEA
jgi:hypothetical protein